MFKSIFIFRTWTPNDDIDILKKFYSRRIIEKKVVWCSSPTLNHDGHQDSWRSSVHHEMTGGDLLWPQWATVPKLPTHPLRITLLAGAVQKYPTDSDAICYCKYCGIYHAMIWSSWKVARLLGYLLQSLKRKNSDSHFSRWKKAVKGL